MCTSKSLIKDWDVCLHVRDSMRKSCCRAKARRVRAATSERLVYNFGITAIVNFSLGESRTFDDSF